MVAVLGLTFHYLAKKQGDGGLGKPDKKRIIQQAFVDNPTGSRQIFEERHGKYHLPRGHFPTGRNHSGRRKKREFEKK